MAVRDADGCHSGCGWALTNGNRVVSLPLKLLIAPSTVLCVMPQVFHGMSTDVTMTASSVLRKTMVSPCRPTGNDC